MIWILILGLSFLFSPDTPWSDRLNEKVGNSVKLTYELEDFELEEIRISNEEEQATASELSQKLFRVKREDTKIGYIYVSQAPSMKDVFDYIVLFDNELTIKNTKVLIYREQHGRQIGSKRWLSQFFGMTPEDRPEYGENIDGISGATISVKSMTLAVNQLLSSIDYLQAEDRF